MARMMPLRIIRRKKSIRKKKNEPFIVLSVTATKYLKKIGYHILWILSGVYMKTSICPMTMIMNHPNAMLECMYPSSLFLFHNFTWNRQSQNQSLMFLPSIFGLRNDRKNFFLSSRSSSAMTRTAPIPHQHSTKVIPIMNGRMKLSNPDGYRSLIGFPPFYRSCRLTGSDVSCLCL